MKIKILYIERKRSDSVSIERVFKQVSESISKKKFEIYFDQLPFSNDFVSTVKNLLTYRKRQADIYHVTGHIHYIALILPKKNSVLTIHDTGILYIRRGLRRFVLKKLLFDLPLRKLKYITAISESTKNEIIAHTNCDPQKIRVIENPLINGLTPQKSKIFNQACPTILQIGTTENKNLSNLIKSLEGINCKLKIIGSFDEKIEHLLNLHKIKYDNSSGLNDEQIKNEYEEADLVTFCSTFEGFGLPIIEAQAMGKPVLTSNLDPMREVAGGAAVLVDPFDIESIRTGILNVIENSDLRSSIIKKGFINIERFEPSLIGASYESLYEEIMQNQVKTN